jgi:integrase
LDGHLFGLRARVSPRFIHGHLDSQHYESLGAADDIRDAENLTVFSFPQGQALARAFFERRARELAGEIAPSTGTFTVADSLSRYLESYRRRGGKALDKMASVGRTYLVEELGRIAVAKLTKGRIEKWHEQIATSPARVRVGKGQSQRFRKTINGHDGVRQRKATANRALTVLKSALNHAYHEGLVARDDAWRRVKAFRGVDAARVQYLSDDECRSLVNACDPDFRHLVIAALMTGCRYGELVTLTAADFNVDSNTICIRSGKSGKPRYVAVSDEGCAYFCKATLGRAPTDILFMKANGRRWQRSEQQRPFLLACKNAGLSNIRFHGLRHTYASRLVMKGAPLAVVAHSWGTRIPVWWTNITGT